MKVLCSQEVVSPHLCGVVPSQVTAQVSAPQGPWCVRCVWLQQGVRKDLAWSKPTDFEALSCGSFRKKARNLIATTQRKSQSGAPFGTNQRLCRAFKQRRANGSGVSRTGYRVGCMPWIGGHQELGLPGVIRPHFARAQSPCESQP
jgi:hypothetical protein